jgi:2-C-methyl-D-erythritol 2,4-cyclodiphosphate synthase
MTARVGIGYDSHRFAAGGPLILGGIRIPSDTHLHGHSDGDAVAHAVTDALLGAAAAGDIGEMFSDQDPAHRGRDSMEMLRAAVARVRSRGLGVSAEAVSIKGKTNEGMGWIGRGEGLACMAVATVVPLSSRTG